METKLYIEGGTQLNGTIAIDSSKNALLPIIAGTILTNGVTTLKNVPHISDIENLLKILVSLGIKSRFSNGNLEIDTRDIKYNSVDNEAAKKIRGSIFILGAIIARFGMASITYPGGCAIGSRPIDLHLQALRDLGISIDEKSGIITCKRKKSKDTDIYLDFASVGATENVILASALGTKRVRIINAAREPEVEDLCNFLNSCGAAICGQGTSTITIQGVKSLNACTYTAIPDRINTGSYLIAAAACGGEVTLTNTIPHHNANLISKLKKSGCDIFCSGNTICIKSSGRLKALGTIHTATYPGFPTDLQSQIAVLSCICHGTTTITENLFESRFRYVPELTKIGARICQKDKSIIIRGVKELAPSNLYAHDLRGGVSLVIAALLSHGKSVVHNAEYVYRGHQAIEKDLVALGSNIIRVDETDNPKAYK